MSTEQELLRGRIRSIGDPLIAAGKNDLDVRAEIYSQLGIGIGGGGGGLGQSIPRCRYCGANGGGHGGLCPNGDSW